MIFAGRCRVYPLAVKLALLIVDPLAWSNGQAIDLDDFKVFGYLCTKIERIGIVVQIMVFRQTEIEPALPIVSLRVP